MKESLPSNELEDQGVTHYRPDTTKDKELSEIRSGRTLWDFLSEIQSARNANKNSIKKRARPTWYKYAFYIIITTILSYNTYVLYSKLKVMEGYIKEARYTEKSMQQTLKDFKNSLAMSPVMAFNLIKHSLDIVTCRTKGFEALQRIGGKNVTALPQNSVGIGTTTLKLEAVGTTLQENTFSFGYTAFIACSENGTAYLSVYGPNVDKAIEYRVLLNAKLLELIGNN